MEIKRLMEQFRAELSCEGEVPESVITDIRATCLRLMRLRPSTAEHAELLVVYALSYNGTDGRYGVAEEAARACELAIEVGDYVLAVEADCLALYCVARRRPSMELLSTILGIRGRLAKEWQPSMTAAEVDKALSHIVKFVEYYDRLLEQRKAAFESTIA